MRRSNLLQAALLAIVVCVNGFASGVIDERLRRALLDTPVQYSINIIVAYANGIDVRERAHVERLIDVGAKKTTLLWVIDSIAVTINAEDVPAIADLPGVTLVRLDESVAITAEAPAEPAGDQLDAPQGLEATEVAHDRIILTWRDSDGAASYRLYQSLKYHRALSKWVRVADDIFTTHFERDGVHRGTRYTYAVSAVTADGLESPRSTLVSVRTLQPPRAYRRIHASGVEVFAIVGQSFHYKVDSDGEPPSSFSLETAPQGMTVDAQTGLVSWTPRSAAERLATATVIATNSEGRSEHTFEIVIYPAGTDKSPPAPVRYPQVDAYAHNGCSLSWARAADDVGVVGYRIWAQQYGRGHRLFVAGEVDDGKTRIDLDTLKPGTGYRLWVQAYDAAGNRAMISGMPAVFVTTRRAPATQPQEPKVPSS